MHSVHIDRMDTECWESTLYSFSATVVSWSATLNTLLLYYYYCLYIINVHYQVFIYFHYYQPLASVYIYFC